MYVPHGMLNTRAHMSLHQKMALGLDLHLKGSSLLFY